MALPIVSIQANYFNQPAEEGENPGKFTVTRTGDTTADLTVNYSSPYSGAVGGVDYTPALSGTVTILAGETSADITITPVDDSIYEGDEEIYVELTSSDNYEISNPSYGYLEIVDNDLLPGIQNPGFEQYDDDNWQSLGYFDYTSSPFLDLPPTNGFNQGFVQTPPSWWWNAPTDTQIETYLGLAPSSLDNLGNGDAVNGSVVNQTIEVKAGDVLTFDWNFLTQEPFNEQPNNDFAFVSIQPGFLVNPPPQRDNFKAAESSVLDTLADITDASLLIGEEGRSGYKHTGYRTYTHTFQTAGTYTIAVGVADEKVMAGESQVLLDNFTLKNSDIVAPTLLSVNPDDNTTGVAVNADLKATFSEPVQKGTGNIVIKRAGGTIVETIDVTSDKVTISDNTVTINPTNNLPGSTDYYVEVGAGAIEDLAGNDFAGITEATTWNFTTGINTITGTANADNLSGTSNKDIINGLEGNDTLSGLGGNDLLIGQAGDDSLNGGAGIDQFEGGSGNDTYVVDNTADSIIELAAQGTDLVQSSVSYILPVNVENLTLTGAGAINATGNALPNVLTGNSGSNTLDGLGGVDQLIGLAGNDTYVVNNPSDVVTEAANAGTDLVNSSVTYTLPVNAENLTLTGIGAINGTGNELANTITGNSGNNTLNGLAGADFLIGNAGNDTYVVDNASDVVSEAINAGTDTVQSSINYALAVNVENLTLTGEDAINGTGNNLVNTIIGNNGNNTLNGLAGADKLTGKLGNDTYVVDNTGDVVSEAANAGTDLVRSSATFTLPANVENLTLTGLGAINGTGNGLVNTITGNNGNNTLNGLAGNDIILGEGGADVLRGGAGTDALTGGAGNDSLSGDAGNDTLTGGLGADKFVYNTDAAFALAAVGKDIIADFTLGQADKIVLDKTTFTAISSVAGVGFSVATEFASVATDAAAATSAADIVYSTTTGGLFYNPNGAAAGFGTGGSFATLTTKPALTANAFELQA